MKKQIIINASKDRSRIAIVEDGELVELYVENPENVRTLGNIYLGKVQKVMPALRAAFVDVGLKQDAFLHFSDLTDNAPQLLAMAGEHVPGLDAPMLSLAPSKRIADDDGEADVEDTLEVEAGDDADDAPKSRTASRRRRGGRGRRGGGGRTEEEEEQEEDGESRPRRRAMVIDLTSKPSATPARPAPRAARPDPAPAVAEAPEADADDAPEAESAPPPRRRTRAAKPAAATEPTVDETLSAEVTDDSAASAETSAHDDSDDDEQPRSRRRGGRRRGRGGDATETTDDDAPTAETSDDDAKSSDEPAAETRDTERDEPRGRSRRGRRDDDRADDRRRDDEAPAARPSRPADPGRRRVDALLDAALGNLSAPVPRRPIALVDDEDADEATDAVAERDTDDARDDDAPRSRRGRSRRDDSPDDEPRGDAPRRRDDRDDGATDDEAPRGRRRADAAEASDDEAPRGRRRRDDDAKGDESSDDDAPRSRRRSRGGRREDERDTDRTPAGNPDKADDTPSTDEADDEREPRSRRGSGRESSSRDRQGRESGSRESSGRESNGRGRGESSRDSSRGESRPAPRATGGKIPPTEELLRRDGRVLVKITKEPISAKGSRVSTDLSLAGRFLVLVPAADYVAVSKKIESAKERRRLRTLAQSLKPEGFGVIVRTVAEGRDAKSLDTDLRLLADKWRSIEKKLAGKPQPPVLLYEDVNMVSSIIRDLFSDDFDRILVDDPKVFKNVQAYVKAVAPQMADKVELHRGSSTAFRAVGIERQVEEAFSKRVNMRGGGYLFIETTEAMHVVDVNSGRAGRGKSQKDNLIAVNVEAAREVAKQLRLRDLGGIIVVDFIDLKYDRDRKKVTDALKEAFAKDRAVTKLLPMSDFGLVQITRQRLRPSITTQATDEDGEPLDAAEAARLAGAGEIAQPGRRYDDRDERDDDDRRSDDRRSEPRAEAGEPAVSGDDVTPEALARAVRAWLDRYRGAVDDTYKKRPILVRVHPLLGAHLRRGLVSPIARWKLSLRGIPFQVQDDAGLHPLAFDVRDEKSGRSLLKKYAA